MTLIHGDCIEAMAAMEPDSIDAIVTDPPYGIGFMGKAWDSLSADPVEASWNVRGRNTTSTRDPGAATPAGRSTTRTGFAEPNPRCANCGRTMRGRDTVKGFKVCHCETPVYAPTPNRSAQRSQAWHEAWARAAYRVAKPGAYLLAFGGTRTVHRMTCAIEDAGWIIRDMLVWGYASGFPKGRANLKPAWEPIVMARKPGPLRPLAIDACRIPGALDDADRPDRFGTTDGGTFAAFSTPPVARVEGRWPANVILTDPIFDGGWDGVVGGGSAPGAISVERNRDGEVHNEIYGAMRKPAREDQGYGDSGTYSRFFIIPKSSRSDREPVLGGLAERRQADDGPITEYVHPTPDGIGAWLRAQRERAGLARRQVAGHFPSRTGGITGCVTNWEEELNRPTPEQWRTLRDVLGFDGRYDTQMTAVRDVTLAERDARSTSANLELMRRVAGLGKTRANHHPTVKPTDLMRHLVRLVTPPGGTVLDPFGGSGTTALAAEMEGFDWILIEKEAEYVAIAEARLNGTQRGLGLTG